MAVLGAVHMSHRGQRKKKEGRTPLFYWLVANWRTSDPFKTVGGLDGLLKTKPVPTGPDCALIKRLWAHRMR